MQRKSKQSTRRVVSSPLRRRTDPAVDEHVLTSFGTSTHVIPTTVSYRGNPQELKYVSWNIASTFSSVSNSMIKVDMCSTLSAGSEINQRIGRSVFLHRLTLFGQLFGGQVNVALDDSTNVVRLFVVSAPIGWVPSTPVSVSSILDARGIGCERIYLDQLVNLTSPGHDTVGYIPATAMISNSINLARRKINFSGSAQATNVGTTLFLCMVSDSSAVPNPGFLNGNFTLQFTE